MKPYHLAGHGSDTVLLNNFTSKITRRRLRPNASQAAFSRTDLLLALTALGLLLGTVFPLLANTKARADQVACVNNLRRIGQAFHCWGNDNGDRTPARVTQSEGGLSPMSIGSPWMVFLFLRNELGTPQVLACPADTTRVVARDFTPSINGGLAHVNYQDRAVSYTVGLHAAPDEPYSMLSSDRNLTVSGGPTSCSAGVNNAWLITYNDAAIRWTNSIHYPGGNMLFNSGAVEQLSTQGLLQALQLQTNSTFRNLHLLVP